MSRGGSSLDTSVPSPSLSPSVATAITMEDGLALKEIVNVADMADLPGESHGFLDILYIAD